ncbi:MAG: ABC transporter permease [Mariprofundaceae bacterium]
MSKREVVGRYQGSIMGLFWSFFNPLLMLIVYAFVFSVIFKARWGVHVTNLDFAAILFSGLIIYTLFSECVARAPLLILENVNYVKKVVFPLEILPWVSMAASVFHACVSFTVLLMFLLIVNSASVHWMVILLPLILLPLVMITLGFTWLLAALGVYLRDIKQAVAIVVMAMLFMSPIFYPASSFPESYKVFFYLNPLTFIIEQTRNVVLWGNLPDWGGLCMYYLISMVIMWLGFVCFQKTRRGFADVL